MEHVHVHVHVASDLAEGEAATALGTMLTGVLRDGLREVDGPTPSAMHLASALYAVASSLDSIAKAIKSAQKPAPIRRVKGS